MPSPGDMGDGEDDIAFDDDMMIFPMVDLDHQGDAGDDEAESSSDDSTGEAVSGRYAGQHGDEEFPGFKPVMSLAQRRLSKLGYEVGGRWPSLT